jgi:pimeloyl-ACP methyl ester carboxylesterase
MLAIRYALTYPTAVEQLVLVDPIGLDRAAGSSFAAKSPVLKSLMTETGSPVSPKYRVST